MGLASKLSFAAASTAVTAFTKKAVTAALEESKAVAVLNNQLKNLGLAFAATGVNTYIDNLQRATAVSEDQLRPAFSQLIRATNDLGKAQQLLALSLDISAGTGKSLEAITMSLNRAYLGNTTALGRLGVGITKAELKTLSFEQIQKRLTTLFAGSAKAAVDTYAGSMAQLQIAANEASETIGIALVESIAKLSGDQGVNNLTLQLESLAQSNADVITGLTDILAKFQIMKNAKPSKGSILDLIPIIGPTLTDLLRSRGERVRAATTATSVQSPRAIEQAAAKAAKARKKEIADRSKIVTITKQQAANEKLSRMFDMDSIQLAAALQYKLSKEDEARVKALQALKTEDKNDDIKALDDLENAKRDATFDEIARMKLVVEENKKSNAEILADAKSRIAAINALVSGVGSSAAQNFVTGITGIAAGTGIGAGPTNLPVDVSNMPTIGGGRDLIDEFNMEGTRSSAGPSSVTVNVNPTGSGFIGNVDDFERIVQTAVQSLNTAGNSLTRAGG
jgi:hypothetical protein